MDTVLSDKRVSDLKCLVSNRVSRCFSGLFEKSCVGQRSHKSLSDARSNVKLSCDLSHAKRRGSRCKQIKNGYCSRDRLILGAWLFYSVHGSSNLSRARDIRRRLYLVADCISSAAKKIAEHLVGDACGLIIHQ
jgi:hypothetical protein